MCATRYALMMLRHASTDSFSDKWNRPIEYPKAAMSDDVHKITIQLRAPRANNPGKVAIGYYVIADSHVVLTDETGKPLGNDKHQSCSKHDRMAIFPRGNMTITIRAQHIPSLGPPPLPNSA
jgi:hypothetical protein